MAEPEPPSTPGRLSDVNPGTLPSADHARHDRWLVVRAASHDADLTPAESASARALLDGCHDCASLAADITTIAHATAVSLAPARPRDFRLTPTQAAAARGGVLDRVGRWLASPRATMLRPLAGASLAIGIVLVAVGPSIRGPLQAQAPTPNAGVAAPVQSASAAETATPDAAHIMEMQVPPEGSAPPNPEARTGLAPEESPGAASNSATQPPDASGISRVAKATPAGTAEATPEVTAATTPEPRLADIQGSPAPRRPPGAPDRTRSRPVRPRSPDDTQKAVVLLGIVLAGTGILVLVLTWLARRWTRDPLLPG